MYLVIYLAKSLIDMYLIIYLAKSLIHMYFIMKNMPNKDIGPMSKSKVTNKICT